MEHPGILPSDIVTLTRMGHILEVQYMEKMNKNATIQKINKDQYIVKETGEIKNYEHIENRQGSINSLRQTFKSLRYLINNNITGAENELHCILTYKENMTDTKRLYRDFDNFRKRMERKFGKCFDYIAVPEPQERGAWHWHLLLRFNDGRKAYIKNSDMRELWKQGYVQIKSLKGIDNIGAYLSAYLGDIELTDDNLIKTWETAPEDKLEVREKEVNGEKKKFIKGGRLHLYPPGMNIVRNSRGMKKPERKTMTYKNAKKIVGSAQPHYSMTKHIEGEDFENVIIKHEYNQKR